MNKSALLLFGVVLTILCVLFLWQTSKKQQKSVHQTLPVIPVMEDFSQFDLPVQQQFKERYDYLGLLKKQEIDVKKRAWGIGQLCKLFHAYSLLDEARDCYLNAVANNEDEIEWRYLLAHVYKGTGKFEEASHYFLGIVTQYDYDLAKIWLAEVYYEQRKIQHSLDLYEELILSKPNHPQVLYGLALAKREQKMLSDAMELLLRLEKMQPKAYQVHYQLGQIYAQTREIDLAKRHLAQVPEDGMLRVSLTFHDPFMQEISDLRRSAQSEVRRGRKAAAQNNYPLAVKYFEKAIAANSQRSDTRYNLALTLFRMGDLVQSKKVLNDLFLIDDKHKSSYLLMAKIHKRNKQDDMAQQFLNQAKKIEQDNGGS